MGSTMKAAIFHGSGKPLTIENIAIPEVGENEILVKVAACGVCHTDLHYIDHGVPTFKKPPMILGHEASGIVAAAGKGVKRFREGDRVLIPAVFTCGSCKNCRNGRENICDEMQMLGNNIDGAYAEYVKVPAKDCNHLPEQIPIDAACIIADAVSTPFHAVKNRGNVKPGDYVVVFGCGGVGINVVQIASAVGASVLAIDIMDYKLNFAKEMGAVATLNTSGMSDKEIIKSIRNIFGTLPDIAFEAIGNPKTIEIAYNCLRPGGRLVQIGYTHENVSINAGRLMYREIEVMGSLGCRPVDYPPLIEMVRTGKIKILPLITHKFKLDEINTAFDMLRKGESIRSIIVF
ncbi:MAG: zinc-binding dehydrogenase [Candidatus Aenigmatarchaeota archaeon]